MSAIIKTISDHFAEFANVSPSVFVLLFLFALNFMMRRSPWIPNAAVMWISTVAGMLLYPIFVETLVTVKAGLMRNILTGFMVGAGAWGFYLPVVIFAETKWPWLAKIINGPEASDAKHEVPPAAPPSPGKD